MFILNCNSNIMAYMVKSIFLCVLTAFLIGFITYCFFYPIIGEVSLERGDGYVDFFGSIILAPFFETLLLVFFVFLTKKLISNMMFVSLFVALLFSIMHSTISILWGVVVFFPFCIYVLSYQVWLFKSNKYGFFTSASIHAGVNATSVLLSSLLFS